MRRFHLIAALALLTVALGGCSWLGAGEIQRQLEQGSSERVIIPDELDSPVFVDAMPIPEISDPRGLVGQDYEVRMPDVLSTSFGVEQIVIKTLGDDRWIFLDVPPAVVWPKVVQYWEANNVDVDLANPGEGVLESDWLAARDGTAAEIIQSIADGDVFPNATNVTEHRFLVRVEPGIRSGSTEIYLEQASLPTGPLVMTAASWDGESDNTELEAEMLRQMAFYLGETITQGTISMMATGLENRTSRAELVPDRIEPVLKYKLDFNRAWATVGNALENARVPVEDLDRTSATYFVYYSTDFNPEPGFFGKLFGRKKPDEDPNNRYTVRLKESGNEVHVTVLRNASQAEPLIAERLLKVIKEYST